MFAEGGMSVKFSRFKCPYMTDGYGKVVIFGVLCAVPRLGFSPLKCSNMISSEHLALLHEGLVMKSSAPKGSDSPTAMPPPVSRALRQLGRDLSVARRMRRMTQQGLAQRMDTSVSTVRRMEDGKPGTALHTFLRALHVLGRLDDVVKVMALDQDTLGLELARERLPQRVRSATGKRAKMRPDGASAKGRETAGDDDELEGF